MQSIPHLFGALGLSLLASGCFASRAQINTPLELARFEALELGTPARDVLAALGAPVEVVQLGTRSAYLYEHTAQKKAGLFLFLLNMLNEDTNTDRAWLFFDEADRLTHVGTTLDADEVEYSLPFE
ncbi:MAG: hypothetical protein WD226_11495 [Planctomycetota bacterium]